MLLLFDIIVGSVNMNLVLICWLLLMLVVVGLIML